MSNNFNNSNGREFLPVTFGAIWMLLCCLENPKMFNIKGYSLKGFAPGDCSYQTMGVTSLKN
jgi:hypothetical protein